MISEAVLQAFLLTDYEVITPLQAGLINHSYCVTLKNGSQYFLQQINTGIFTVPIILQQNYSVIEQHLAMHSAFRLPALIPAANKELLYEYKEEAWRCFEYLQNTFSPPVAGTAGEAYEVARCFGLFTAALHTLNIADVQTVLPRFHDLQMRYGQFKTAMANAPAALLEKEVTIINIIESNNYLVDWYNKICANKRAYPLHIMHHDCKISNISFDANTNTIISPVDLDTTQPGLFFSDLGDMIRSMVPNLPEDAANTEELEIRTDFYDAIIKGYTDAMQNLLTPQEKGDIHYAGLAMVYMQTLRFFTDYLNSNIYYKVSYAAQNRDRTLNQLKLLRLLTAYTSGKMANG